MPTPKKKKRKGPRWTKLTAEVEETILRHLRTGAFRTHAAEAAGISADTLDDWMRRGADGERPFAAFAVKVRKALAEDAIRSQSIITRAQLQRVDGDWKAAAWALERKHPRLYGHAAMVAAASVTIQPSADHDGPPTTQVQFYLPDNGRRPQDEDGEGADGADR